jgi:putative intracellular protease/amidase
MSPDPYLLVMRIRVWSAVGIAIGALVAAAAVVLFLVPIAPPDPSPASQPVPSAEHARTIEGLKPPKRAFPVIALLALNERTEITDLLIPYGVLRQSGLAEVTLVAIEPGPIKTYPADLSIEPQATTRQMDERYPDGVDYVIVPAMEPRTDPAVIAWIKAQAGKGATIVSVCRGALTAGAAGLLDGRSATTHWFSVEELRENVPTMRWASDRRYVVDRGVATATGITASMPVSLALVEAIGGHARAAQLATQLGVHDWDARHDSDAYHIDATLGRTALRNVLAFWRHETLGLQLEDGADEIVLALAGDAYSRTWRSHAVFVGGERPITTRRGLRVVAGGRASDADHMLASFRGDKPAEALPKILDDIAQRYDESTAAFVAVQLEYPWRESLD